MWRSLEICILCILLPLVNRQSEFWHISDILKIMIRGKTHFLRAAKMRGFSALKMSQNLWLIKVNPRSSFDLSFKSNQYQHLNAKSTITWQQETGAKQGRDRIYWRDHNVTVYRFSEWQQNLSSEHMTVVSRCGAVDHNPVTVIQLLYFKISTELLQQKQ